MALRDSQEYFLDEELDSRDHHDRRSIWSWRLLEHTLVGLALCVSTALVVVCPVQLRSATLQQTFSKADPHAAKVLSPTGHGSPPILSCAPSADAPRPADCIFDEMLNGWVHPACYNQKLAEEALRNDTLLAMHGGSGPFPWWQDMEHTIPLHHGGLEEYVVSEAADMKAYTWEKWHVAHCLYVWRLGNDIMKRAAEGERNLYVDDRVLDSEHIYHCNNVIANQDHRVGAKAVVSFGYHKCVQIVA